MERKLAVVILGGQAVEKPDVGLDVQVQRSAKSLRKNKRTGQACLLRHALVPCRFHA